MKYIDWLYLKSRMRFASSLHFSLISLQKQILGNVDLSGERFFVCFVAMITRDSQGSAGYWEIV